MQNKMSYYLSSFSKTIEAFVKRTLFLCVNKTKSVLKQVQYALFT